MLRAKQPGNLSSSARPFFLSGPWCSAADGSSCACSEDDTCVPSGQHSKNSILLAHKTSTLVNKTPVEAETLVSVDTNGVVLSQKPSTLASKTAVRAENSVSGGAIKLLGSRKDDNVIRPASLPKVVLPPSSFCRSDCVNYASGIDVVEKGLQQSSCHMSDQFVKAGIAAVSFLSDLVNYKPPTSNASGISSPNNCMVDPTRQLSNIKPAN